MITPERNAKETPVDLDARLRFVKHKGHAIYLLDFSHCSTKELLLLLDQVRADISRHAPGSARHDFVDASSVSFGRQETDRETENAIGTSRSRARASCASFSRPDFHFPARAELNPITAISSSV